MPSVIVQSSGSFDDGYLLKSGSVSGIEAARNVTTAQSGNVSASTILAFHGKVFANAYLYRTLINFDLSGNDIDGDSLSGNTVESATITVVTLANLSGFSNITAQTSNSLYLCKTDGISTSFNTADWNALDGWVSSGSYDGEVTVYSTANEAAGTTITFTLNSECISDINSAISGGDAVFPLAILNQDDFLSNVGTGGLGSPNTTGGFAQFDGVRFTSKEASGSDCFRLNLTYASESAVVENAVFFGTNF